MSLASISNSFCTDGQGFISVAVEEGVPPYNFNWSPNANSSGSLAEHLTAGSYSVTVTDANGCTDVWNQNIEFIAGPSLNINSETAIFCSLDNGGAIELSVASGTPPYNYSWSHDPGLNSPNASNLAPGEYTARVTDAHGCTASVSTSLPFVEGPSAAVGLQNNACQGQYNGSITLVTSGGTGNLSYHWSHNAALNSPFAGNLAAGTYRVTVSDANNCQAIVETNITELTTPTLHLLYAEESGMRNSNRTIDCRSDWRTTHRTFMPGVIIQR